MSAAKPLDDAQLAELCRMNALGINDSIIARSLGVPVSRIYKARIALGLPARYGRFAPTIEQLRELQTTSNRAMQRKYGNDASQWARARITHGIPHFRPPTRGPNAPAPKPKPVKAGIARPPSDWGVPRALPVPPRDYSLAGEAAAFLQRERFHCFNRKKVLGGEGWQVGRMVLDEPAMIDMAKRRGFAPEPWMEGRA